MFKLKFGRKKIKENDIASVAPPGSAPGTLVVSPDAKQPVVRTLAYGTTEFVEGEIENIEDIQELVEHWPVTWIDVRGLGDTKLLRQIGSHCDIHKLALEDVVSSNQRPKVEEYDANLFVVIRMLESSISALSIDQLSMFIFENYIVTFQASESDCLDPVRNRIKKGRGKIRGAGADYLAYTIIDAVIDAYFPILEEYGKKIEVLEEKILENPESRVIKEIHDLKRELLVMRRNILPVREALIALTKESYSTVSEETRLYLRDCYDHALRIIDLIAAYRQSCSDLMELYLSLVSNKMNEVMKVLTVISTIFIPPTFLAGVYGMNFNTEISKWNMPELNSMYGYPICLTAMVFIAMSVIAFLYTKGWLRTN